MGKAEQEQKARHQAEQEQKALHQQENAKMLSIVIPSKNERFLYQTITDVLEKAYGEIEVFPVLNGYDITEEEKVLDERVKYLQFEDNSRENQKRQAVVYALSLSSGEYVMSLDAHCMMAEGFDLQLVKDHGGSDWIQIPRRQRLDATNWCLQKNDDRPPIDYEHFLWPLRFPQHGLHGFRWDERTYDRWDIPIDDTMESQGSCWFMKRGWFEDMGFFRDMGYEGWGQEAEEYGLSTLKAGGRLITNKNTWYAHLHKGKEYGRMYHLSQREARRSSYYAYNKWVWEEREFFTELVERFWPLPKWPENWKDLLWKEKQPKPR